MGCVSTYLKARLWELPAASTMAGQVGTESSAQPPLGPVAWCWLRPGPENQRDVP